MIPSIKVVHFLPGRIRAKSPFLRHNEDIETKIHKIAKYFPVIEDVEVNSVSGSILVKYNRADEHGIHKLLIWAQLLGYIPGSINLKLLVGIMCGSVEKYKGLQEFTKLENAANLMVNKTGKGSSTDHYLSEMTSQALYFMGFRTLLSVAMNSIPLWLDNLWVGYNSASALNYVFRQDITG